MLRSLGAVLGGFVAMAVIVVVSTALAAESLIPGGMEKATTPGTPLPHAYLRVNLAASAFAAVAGGFVTGWIAATAPLLHGLALAGLMIVMSLLSARQSGATQPRWYQLVLTFVMPFFALAGAWMAGAFLMTP